MSIVGDTATAVTSVVTVNVPLKTMACTPTLTTGILPDLNYNIGSGIQVTEYTELVNGNCQFTTSNQSITPALAVGFFT